MGPLFVKQDETPAVPAVMADERLRDWKDRLNVALNTDDDAVSTYVISTLASVLKKSDLATTLSGIIAEIRELVPRDSAERMLIAQMALVHHLALNYLAKGSNTFSAEDQSVHTATALRLMRMYSQQLETLRRYRRNGEQKITVTHVTAQNAVVMPAM